MTENKIKEIAEMLGIEIGVPFNIKGYQFNPCILTRNSIENKLGNTICVTLFKLLTGELEIEKPILDDIEKRYLEGVFRPFKNRIMYIEKVEQFGYEYIRYRVSMPVKKYGNESCVLPYFNKGTMYKGMKYNQQYSLEELGLFEQTGKPARKYRNADIKHIKKLEGALNKACILLSRIVDDPESIMSTWHIEEWKEWCMDDDD